MPDAPENLPLLGFGLSNYRSFDGDGFVLRKLGKVNVFIGKNNSGKSNVLRSIRLLARLDRPGASIGPLDTIVDGHRGSTAPPAVTVIIPTDAVLTPEKLAHPDVRWLRPKFAEQMVVTWDLEHRSYCRRIRSTCSVSLISRDCTRPLRAGVS